MPFPILKRAAILLLVGSFGWSQTPTAHLPTKALRVPLFRQATGYSCGAAALQAILRYWQVFQGQESQLYERLGTTPKDGTHPNQLVEGARSFGLTARLQENTTLADLRKAVALGQTVILNLQAWRDAATPAKPWKETWEEGHYVVLVGLDRHNLYAMDPSVSGAYAYLPLPEFLDRWHDYEDRTGTRHDYHHLAIFIQGTKPAGSYPGTPVRME
jgi:predicted double-glycine peptidase